MLISIESSVFRVGKIEFHPGLNVVLGDENATNSIGKSTLLMVVDFAFGGNSLLGHNQDLISELGDHSYQMSFLFDGKIYRFARSTDQADFVFPVDNDGGFLNPLSIDKYAAFLRASYEVGADSLSFRALVGLYFRVWGKENDDVHRPLHIAKGQAARDCVDNLIKTYNSYSEIKLLAADLNRKEQERSAFRAASKNKIVPKITKTEHDANTRRMGRIEKEIDDIKMDLAKYAANINQIVNAELLDSKVKKDELLAQQVRLRARLARIDRNISGNRHIQSKFFAPLVEFFPEVNAERIAKVEEFHDGVAKILKAELQEERRDLLARLSEIDAELKKIEEKMSSVLSAVDEPGIIVDRIYDLSTAWNQASRENNYYSISSALSTEVASLKNDLELKKNEILAVVQRKINGGLRAIVARVFEGERKSPTIRLSNNNYSYEVFEDTGTGVAYSALIMFDLTVFSQTTLPCLAHDSMLFKNVENDSVAKLFSIYDSNVKQSFIAIDEIQKYGAEVAAFLRAKSVIQLNDKNVLYVKDWRSKKARQ
ncbi:DUF2326 domain-containing protein [Lysobacter enzymogenes]|uniref:DUF2326 domain-containing protein n=1 Tax=Lysobacter enzymogenes TaxID=69 RepID=UPI00099CC9E9|nr:DUF2326 domain-containing protein [Lysobacter enzymogenes]UZW61170.1 DUF2326 domain-containing protein [Lysobacter enzymogenes]